MNSAATTQAKTAPVEVVYWSPAKRAAFRFVFCYLGLYLTPRPGDAGLLGYLPRSSAISDAIAHGWMKLLPWVALHVFHFAGQAFAQYRLSGSGDKALDYVMRLVCLLIAAIATLVWSLADSKRPNYVKLDSWLRVGVRYFLIYQMIVFGVNKVLPIQFVFPNLVSLLTPTGMRSLAGTFWTLTGASTAYVIFSGSTELLAAILLIFNRTQTLGAIVTAGVMSNVVAINYGYNLGVKIFSLHLLLMAIFLIAPHLRVLADFFVFHKPGYISEIETTTPKSRWFRLGMACVKVILLGTLVWNTTAWNWANYKRVRSWPAQTPLFGIYDVESFARGGRELPPLTTDGSRWRRVILQTPTGVVVQGMTGAWPWPWYRAKYDPDKNTLSLFDVTTKSPLGQFAYSQPEKDRVVLEGVFQNEPLVIQLRRIDTATFPLVNDRFDWIHEVPPSNQ